MILASAKADCSLPGTLQVAHIVEGDSRGGADVGDCAAALRASSIALSVRGLLAISSAPTETLVIVVLSIDSADGLEVAGTLLALVLLLLESLEPSDESVDGSFLAALFELFHFFRPEFIQVILYDPHVLLFLRTFFAPSKVLKDVSPAGDVANVFVGDSALATDWQEDLRAIVAADFQTGTFSVAAHLHTDAVHAALVVVGQSVDSADRSVLFVTITRSQAGSSAHTELTQTVQETLVFKGVAVDTADGHEWLVAAVARKKHFTLLERLLSAGSLVSLGHIVGCEGTLIEVSDCILSADGLVDLGTLVGSC